MPVLELLKFDGDPTFYSQFMAIFEAVIERQELNKTRQLLFLVQHCTGRAKLFIKYCICMLLNTDEGYVKSKYLLHKTYDFILNCY